MKRVKLIKTITGLGCVLLRHGAKHDWYHNQATRVSQPIPRHRDIGEGLARHIIKMLGNTPDRSQGRESAGENASS